MQVRSARSPDGSRAAPRRPVQRWMACERALDATNGFVLLACLVAAPWFASLPDAIGLALFTGAAYFAGGLWVAGVLIRRVLDQFPLRWATPPTIAGHRLSWITRTLALLNLAFLGYVALAFVNARAVYSIDTQSFTYLEYFSWLPTTYDRQGTSLALATWAAASCLFWALRDWLLRVEPEEAPFYYPSMESGRGFLPGRARLLLWVLILNGSLLAAASMFTRSAGTSLLLWPWKLDGEGLSQGFGPFANNGLAAAYFNLVWPASLAFWWILRRERRGNWIARTHSRRDAHLLLLPLTILCAASPVVSADRLGAALSVAMLALAALLLWMSRWANRVARTSILAIMVSTMWLGGYLGWEPLKPGVLNFFEHPVARRPQIYLDSARMVEDFPFYGVGPGAFESLHGMYREEPSQPRSSHLDDDWVEFRVTLGWVGSSLLMGLLAVVLGRHFAPGGFPAPTDFVALLWVGLGGCLLAAKFHHPLQSLPVISLVCVYGAVLFSGSRPSSD